MNSLNILFLISKAPYKSTQFRIAIAISLRPSSYFICVGAYIIANIGGGSKVWRNYGISLYLNNFQLLENYCLFYVAMWITCKTLAEAQEKNIKNWFMWDLVD